MCDSIQEWFENITDKTELSELNALTEEEKKERFSSELRFGTGGLRGIVGIGTNCMNIFWDLKRATVIFSARAAAILQIASEATSASLMRENGRKMRRLYGGRKYRFAEIERIAI